MPLYGDLNSPDGHDGDSMFEQPTDWFDPVQDELADSPEADLGDGGYLKPWKTTDI